mmetsp:Transcript_25967/g.39234  ORF Transcript_25967/g.39234 Transcript_25967/m.39234 type:complete len:237 (-) Transcript_25967:375-1085(-)
MDSEPAVSTKTCCASCGIEESHDIKLKSCTACKLVRYCSVKCQREHRPKHKQECKKRAAELHDAILFRQPASSHLGDCPICLVPLPIDENESCHLTCCSKTVCKGCDYTNQMGELKQSREPRCPFCRKHAPITEAASRLNVTKRLEANDPYAMKTMGVLRYAAGDYGSAFEYYTKAAVSHFGAHFQLSNMYREGQGVKKDLKKELYHAEKAAIGGHQGARYNLGCEEEHHGRWIEQ